MENESSESFQEINKVLNQDNIQLGKEIGKGGYGRVFKVRYLAKRNWLVMKYISVDKSCDQREREERLKKIKEEVIRSIKLKGVHLVLSHTGYKFESTGSYGLVMEQARHSDLNVFICMYHTTLFDGSYLYNKNKEYFFRHNDNLTHFFFVQVIEGLLCLYKYNLAHLDIKPENILINDLFQVKLCDYGQAQDMRSKYIEIKNGTPSYMSPEYYTSDRLIIDGSLLSKVDAFALGATIFKFLFNAVFIDKNIKCTENKMKTYIRNAYQKINDTSWLNDKLKDLLRSLLSFKIGSRASVQDAFNHSWVANQEKTQLIKKVAEINQNEQVKLFIQLHSMNNFNPRERIRNSYVRYGLFGTIIS